MSGPGEFPPPPWIGPDPDGPPLIYLGPDLVPPGRPTSEPGEWFGNDGAVPVGSLTGPSDRDRALLVRALAALERTAEDTLVEDIRERLGRKTRPPLKGGPR